MTEPTSLPPTIERAGHRPPAPRRPRSCRSRRCRPDDASVAARPAVRWAVALVVVALAVGATAAAAVLLTGARRPRRSPAGRLLTPSDSSRSGPTCRATSVPPSASSCRHSRASPTRRSSTASSTSCTSGCSPPRARASSRGRPTSRRGSAGRWAPHSGRCRPARPPNPRRWLATGVGWSSRRRPTRPRPWHGSGRAQLEAGKTVTTTTHAGDRHAPRSDRPTGRWRRRRPRRCCWSVTAPRSRRPSTAGGDAGLGDDRSIPHGDRGAARDRLTTTYLDTAALVAALGRHAGRRRDRRPGARSPTSFPPGPPVRCASNRTRSWRRGRAPDRREPGHRRHREPAAVASAGDDHRSRRGPRGRADLHRCADPRLRHGRRRRLARTSTRRSPRSAASMRVIGWIGEAGLVVLPGTSPRSASSRSRRTRRRPTRLAKSLRNLASIGGTRSRPRPSTPGRRS